MTDTESGLWWRHTWMQAVYASDLKPMQKLIATVFADHARDQRVVWVTTDRLEEFTRMARTTVIRALKGLREAGWLVVVEKGRQHKATRYALVIPEGAGPSGVPVSSTSGGPLDAPSGSAPLPLSSSAPLPQEDPAVALRSSSGSAPLIQQYRSATRSKSSTPVPTSSSSSPAHKHLAGLLGWAEDDERLDLLDDFLKTNNVKSARGWLARCHENGDLERNYLAFVEERQHAEEERRTTSLASLPKCPTCNAPQEITHYDECPDRSWDPHEALEHQPTDRACPYGCGPFVVWTDTGGRCRLCSRYNSFYAGWQTEEFLDELRSVCSSEERLQRALEDEADDLFRDRTKAREPVVIANALLTYRQAVANPNTVTIRRFVAKEAS